MEGNSRIQVRAEMPGIIIHIAVESGASVTEGDELLIMESMKMEIPVEAPRSGVVQEIHVAVGDRAQEEQLLMTLQA
jgi:biotin carboxyl carrier protein